MKNPFNSQYWTDRYLTGNTPWNIGNASTPLTGYLQNYTNKNARILIPGAGNAYEAEWLWNNGFRNTYVADLSELPLKDLQQRVPDFSDDNLLLKDFFEIQDQFDLIVEQTFFCALHPEQRESYARKMLELLKPGGQLIGVLFKFELTENGPPYGGDPDEYRKLFAKYFRIHKLENCYNSIKPRMGNELFIHLLKP